MMKIIATFEVDDEELLSDTDAADHIRTILSANGIEDLELVEAHWEDEV